MERFNKTMSAKGIHRDKEKFNFNNVVQRGDVWDNNKRSLLIHSMLADYPIPPIFAQDGEDQLYILDGKQRLTSIIRFLNDEFRLSSNTPEFNNVDIAGLKFSELDEEIQDKIKDYTLLIYYFRNMAIEERDEMFLRLNNGKALSRIELTRVEAGEEFMGYIRELAKSHFFLNSCNLTPKARERFTDEEIILQCIVMAVEDGTNGLNGKALSEIAKILKHQKLDKQEKEEIEEVIEYLNIAFPEKAKFLKKVNIPIIFYVALQNMSKILPTDFGFAIQEFFKCPTEDYTEACRAGSARAENVKIRVNELEFVLRQDNPEENNDTTEEDQMQEDDYPEENEIQGEEWQQDSNDNDVYMNETVA